MKIERLVSSVAAAALALGLAAAAHASIVTVTWQGVVASGTDQTNLFGLGTNMAGDSYTAVYTIDDSVHAYSVTEPGLATHLFGGTHYSSPTGDQSPLSATITINGVTVTIPGIYWGSVWQSTLANGGAEVFDAAQDQGDNGVNSYADYLENKFFSRVNPIVTTTDYHTPLTYTPQSGDAEGTSFTYWIMNDSTDVYSAEISAILHPTSVVVADGIPNPPPPPSVPEPATWAMLILGLGLIGFAARQRQQGMAASA